MTFPRVGGSQPGPQQSVGHIHLIGEEWIEHGYKATPIFDEVEPCAICDAPNQTCTHFTTTYEGVPVARFEDSALPAPRSGAWQPGSFSDSDRYDVPQGSQASQPSRETPVAPTVDYGLSITEDPDNPGFGLIDAPHASTETAAVESFTFNEDGEYVAIRQD